MDSATEDGIFHARETTSDMSVEFWAIIGVGVGITAVFGAMFTFLNMRISDMRDIAKDLSETIALSEKRTNDRIDGLEKNFREEFRQVEARLNARIDGVEARINSIETTVNARIDGIDARFRVVEQGQARVIGAVEMMQTIVVATLRGEQEEVGAD